MNTILKVNNITKTYNKGQQPSLDKVPLMYQKVNL